MVFKIGLIGLDTSHVEIFSKLLEQNENNVYDDAKVVIGYPCPSVDITLSKSRVEEYTTLLKEKYNVTIVHSIKEVAEHADAIFITALDGRKHFSIFKELLSYEKPVFIDKPMTITEKEAQKIFYLSEKYHTPVMSASSLRFSQSLVATLHKEKQKPTGVYINGPMPFIDHIPYYSWYGIHLIEMLFTILGPNYSTLSIQGNEEYDVITAEWDDGRFGVIRGTRVWHDKFEMILHYPNKTIHLPIYKDEKPYYASLLEEVIPFCKTRQSPIPTEDTLAIMKFIEEANTKRFLADEITNK